MNYTRRQNEIIDAALNLLSTEGIQHLTVKNLSKAINVSEPALYRHFANKAEIVKAVIKRFDALVPVDTPGFTGKKAIEYFIRRRFKCVSEEPSLAKVVFSEELFIEEPEYRELLMNMMNKHKELLFKHFNLAIQCGEIRRDIPIDTLFRLVFGPVRLLVKQWGMTNGAFSLVEKGEELIEALFTVLEPVNHPDNVVKK